MTAHALVLHLRARLSELSVQPLGATHVATGMPVWLLISLTFDAYERAMQGRVG